MYHICPTGSSQTQGDYVLGVGGYLHLEPVVQDTVSLSKVLLHSEVLHLEYYMTFLIGV